MKTNILVLTQDAYDEIARALFDDEIEHMLFGGAGLSEGGGGRRILLRRLDHPNPERDYVFQARAGVSLQPDAVVRVLHRFNNHPVFIDFHNHPTPNPSFSATDDNGADIQYQVLQDLVPGSPLLLQVVFGPDGSFQGRLTGPGLGDGRHWEPLNEILITGADGIRRFSPWQTHEEEDELARSWIRERHVRTLPLMGERPLYELARLRIAVVGVGGIGSAVVQMAKFIFPRLTIIDADRIEVSNLGRLYGATTDDDGELKVDVMAREIHRYDTSADVKTVARHYPSAEADAALHDCDVIIACVDNLLARYELALYAARHHKILVETGTGCSMRDGKIYAVGGQVRLQVPGGPCLSCLNLDTDRLELEQATQDKRATGYIEGTNETPGEIVTTNTAIATFAMRHVLALLSGHLPPPVPTYFYYDEARARVLDLSATYMRRPDCPICGTDDLALAGWGDRLPEALRLDLSEPQDALYEA